MSIATVRNAALVAIAGVLACSGNKSPKGTATGGGSQLTDLMSRYLNGVKLPDEARRSDGFQKLVRGHMKIAEKDLAWALELAREAGVALPAAALASQSMARIYGVEDPKRR